MQKIRERLTSTGTWSASVTLSGIDLPRTGLITELRLRAYMTATLTATAVADATRRALDGITVSGDNLTFWGLTGNIALGVLWALLNLADRGVSGLGANTDVAATTFNQSFVFHPGSYPHLPFDTSVVIPAKKLSSLQAKIVTPAAAVTDAAGNITAGTYYLEADTVKNLPPKQLFMPAGYAFAWNQDANYASFGKEIDVPGGSYLRRIIILSLDDTATVPARADDEIGGVKVFLPKKSTTIMESNWEDLKYATALRYGIRGDLEGQALGAVATTRPGYNGAANLPAGFAIIDFRDFVDPVENPLGTAFGLNLIGNQNGDVKLGLTITNRAAGDATIIYYDMVQPVPANLLD
jgi:hypothetical protein